MPPLMQLASKLGFLLPVAVFSAIAAVVFAVSWAVIRAGRRRAVSSIHRRHLIFGALTLPLANLLPVVGTTWEAIQREVRQAGYYHYRAAYEFLAIRNTLCFGWVILVLAVMIISFEPANDPSLVIGAAGLGVLLALYAIPRLYLQSLARSRVNRIQVQLPDGLDMITMCMTGGLSLGRAIDRVGDELESSHPDLSLELEIIRRQADAHSLEHSLAQFAKRIDVPEVQTLAALVSQTERLGSNVAVALREFADGIRRTFRQRAEERGNRTSVQMMLPVALCLAPPVYILLLAPAALELRSFIVEQNEEGGVLNNQNIGELTNQSDQ